VETALPPSTLATPQATLDDKTPATFGTLDKHPPSLPVLDEPSTPLEDHEEESLKIKLKETVEESTLPLLPTHPFCIWTIRKKDQNYLKQ
jgi:ABC-type transport system involved in cytochrome c biogenesis ATPase subunit